MRTQEDCSRERGVSRRICHPHLRIFLSMTSSWAGVGGKNWLVYVSRGDESAVQDINFAVDRGWSVAYGVEVSVKLKLVVFKL